jgi:hypothetical protein
MRRPAQIIEKCLDAGPRHHNKRNSPHKTRSSDPVETVRPVRLNAGDDNHVQLVPFNRRGLSPSLATAAPGSENLQNCRLLACQSAERA